MNKENFEEAYIRANAQIAFIIAERNNRNKMLKNQAMPRPNTRVFRDSMTSEELPLHSSRPGKSGSRVSGSRRGERKVPGDKNRDNRRNNPRILPDPTLPNFQPPQIPPADPEAMRKLRLRDLARRRMAGQDTFEPGPRRGQLPS